VTDPSDRLPDDFQDRIDVLESDLGRDICGFPTEEFDPCDQWPADESGRCSRHADMDLENVVEKFRSPSSESPQSFAPDKTLNEPHQIPETSPANSPMHVLANRLAGSYWYWLGLILAGLLIGAGAAAVTLDFQPPATKPAQTQTRDVEINFENPDFNKIRELYRNGDYQAVARRLDKIIEKTSDDTTRAQVLYFSFVFHQNQKNYRRALEMADRYLEQYSDHYRRAEVLYGAWFISSRLTDNSKRAKRYRQTLLDEFPDSKWARRLSAQ
jgi:tetratricopeptide (TPR) repeat protein